MSDPYGEPPSGVMGPAELTGAHVERLEETPMATYSTLSHIARGQPLPQADLKVTWSCARCGAVLEQAEVARDEGYYEAEIHFWPVCPSCEPEAVRDAP